MVDSGVRSGAPARWRLPASWPARLSPTRVGGALLATTVLLAGTAPGHAQVAVPAESEEVTGLIVAYEPGVHPIGSDGAPAAAAALPAVPLEPGQALGSGLHSVELGTPVDGAEAEQLARALAESPLVRWAEPDLPVSLPEDPADHATGFTALGDLTAQARQDPAPWGLDRIDQRAGLDGGYSYDTTGAGVTVYVLDTGVRASHREFGGRVRAGFTTIEDGRGTADCNGHGTHVAGTAAGSTYGVAKQVVVVPVRVLDCAGDGLSSDVIAGANWVANHHVPGVPAVAVMSIGGPASGPVDDAVKALVQDGVTVVVAAGNSARPACEFSPGRVPEVITVNAATRSDLRASFSNYGSCSDIYAPGSDIVSALPGSDTALGVGSGTSMAAPHVAGVAARLLQATPSLSPAQVWAAIQGAATGANPMPADPSDPKRLLYATGPQGTVPAPSPAPAPSTGFFLNNDFTGTADLHFRYGDPSDEVVMADWDGDAVDTPAVRRGARFYVRNSNTSGVAQTVFVYGDPGDEVFVGDWDADGTDTMAVRRGNRFYVRNSVTTGVADVVFSYGNPGDEIFVGDWDTDGSDTFAVRRGNTFYVRNTLTSGVAHTVFSYGNPGDEVLVGDWDGNGTDTFAVRRGNAFYVSNSNATGVAEFVVRFGDAGDRAFAGDWDGDGTDTLGLHRR